jgi:hypothetical protein
MNVRTLTSLLAAAFLVAAAAPATGASGLAAATLVPAAGGANSGPPIRPSYPFRPGPVPTPKALKVRGQYYSANWGGFIDGAAPSSTSSNGLAGIGATFDGVDASWAVPQLQPSAPNSYEASWVGLGGVTGTQNLLQAGTIEYFSGPRAEYVAFVEDYPNPPLYVNAPVHPGDAIAATAAAPSSVDVTDYSAGWTTGQVDLDAVYGSLGYTYYAPDQQTAEWIVEDPTCGSMLCAFANFSPETFGPVQDTTSTAITRTPLESIIINAQGQPQVTVSPSSIGTASSTAGSFSAFTVTRASSGGPGPKPGGPGKNGGPGQNTGPGPQR